MPAERAIRSRDGIEGGFGYPTHGRLDTWRLADRNKAIKGLPSAAPPLGHIALGSVVQNAVFDELIATSMRVE
jgi:hypothetical protein